jgi:hypothetical protein
MNSGPKELAESVHKKLITVKGINLPSFDTLHRLFETLFYTSIKTEESDFVKVTVTLIDDKNPDPNPPKRIVAHRWNYVRLKRRIPFTVKNLIKLSKAVDPWSSSIAVYYNTNNELFIWGMIDQAIHYQSFLNYESDSGPEQPGYFQSSITGVGCLIVMLDYELLATLKQNTLITNYIDVFSKGPVYEHLKNNFQPIKNNIKTYVKRFPFESYDFWEDYIEDLCVATLSRILLRIQNYEHGGALLITNTYRRGVDVKYQVNYDRLNMSIINVLKFTIQNSNLYQQIDYGFVENNQAIPVSDYLDESIAAFNKEETKDELYTAT